MYKEDFDEDPRPRLVKLHEIKQQQQQEDLKYLCANEYLALLTCFLIERFIPKDTPKEDIIVLTFLMCSFYIIIFLIIFND